MQPRSAHDQAAHNGRTAQRAFVPHEAQRAIRTTGLRTTPAQRARARRSQHNVLLGSAIRLIISKRRMAITLPGRRTPCRSVAASALHRTTSKTERSRARSGRLQRLVGRQCDTTFTMILSVWHSIRANTSIVTAFSSTRSLKILARRPPCYCSSTSHSSLFNRSILASRRWRLTIRHF